MKKLYLLLFMLRLFCQPTIAQKPETDVSWKTIFRSAPERVNDMVHIKLDAQFDYQKSQLNGKVWLTMKPHFYSCDSVQLDAKGMNIYKVQLVGKEKNRPLEFTYDSLILNIRLGKTFSMKESYILYIEYTAKPNEFKSKGSATINDAKGLYFINPTGTEKDKPTQIWTQGETDANSVWIPIIDKPNQKSTQEMILTVPDKFVTLSNGKLVKQKKNKNGTRTDTWKMDQPHAPYLFFMGVGDYAVVKDSYKGKEVSYYVEKPYQEVARKIFGDTPEMIRFFSEKLGVEYPWVKYAQMTACDYVSVAMENTTATLHGDRAQQNARQLTDGNKWETIIAHELFHHWFGDLVTCESWSNITVNESFADFSEGMWQEHKYGKEEGQAHNYSSRRGYLDSKNDAKKSLVRYFYAEKEDIFDAVSYRKGGAILHMLKNILGEEAFYQSLKTYLTRNIFGTGNARELQQAFEDTTGKDLNWFFNQWYFGTGHPELDISYEYNDTTKKALVFVKQTQTAQVFKLPIFIDVYDGGNATRYFKWIEHAADTFRFDVKQKPSLINVDAEKILLANKNDHKTLSEFIYQYQHAKNYVDRREAVEFTATQIQEHDATSFLQTTLKDPNYRIRWKTLNILKSAVLNDHLLNEIEIVAKSETTKIVKAEALSVLAQQKSEKYKELFMSSLNDSSYTVAGTALLALIDLDEATAISTLSRLKTDARGTLELAVKKTEILAKTDADFDELYSEISNFGNYEKFQNLPNFIFYLKQVNDVLNFKKGVDLVLKIRDEILPYVPSIKEDMAKELTEVKLAKEKKKSQGISANEMNAQIQYIDEFLNK